MKNIYLTKGLIAIVDDDDYKKLSMHKWYGFKNGNTNYAAREAGTVNGKRIRVYMHRYILNAPQHIFVDHKNGNGLDNRKSNIRLCTIAENNMHCLHRGRKDKYRGVFWVPDRGKWVSKIRVSGKDKYLGIFKDEELAAKAYDSAAKLFFRQFAVLNFHKLNGEQT